MEDKRMKLWYTAPADAWYQGMPIGNGRVGAMVRGCLAVEKLAVNEDTLWSGKPYISPRTESHKVYEQIRALSLAGKQQEAAELAALEFSDKVTQMYLPLGDIELSFPGHENAVNYTRELDLETGIVTVNYTVDGVHYTREAFVSHPDQVMVFRIRADKPGALSCAVKLKGALRCTEAEKNGALTVAGNCPNYVFVRGQETKPVEGYAYGERDEDKGVGYLAMLCAETENGPVLPKNGVITVCGAESLVLRFAVRTSFNGFDKHPVLEGREYEAPCAADMEAACAISFEALKKRHIADVTPLFSRMTLKLPEDENGMLPTDERLIRHGAGECDRGLYALLFHFARYLTIASSRPGTQVTNLQGIWNDQLVPPWGCNCTVNINTEMNYWPTLRFGLAECYKPLIDMVKELSKAGTATARDYYAAPGFVCHSATDIWCMCHPQNNGIPGSAQWGFWSGSSGWLSRMLWDYYAFTGDKAYLEEVWPVILAAASFYKHLLVEKDGELIVTPCTSPENNYLIGDKACPVDLTTEMSMAICRDIFRCVSDAAKVLGKAEAAEYDALLPKLRPMQIRRDDGRLNEWYGEYPDWEVHHRHISHLYGLFPGRETMTPELSDAVKKVLDVRGDPSTGWSIAWKTNCWARLGDGDRAEHVLDMQLQPVAGTEEISMLGDGGTFLSMLCAHPPFQIDGNFGAASAIMEMLIWNEGDEVRLLPALPSDWDHGSVSGICLHGG
ncbi:MAG: glycoside hydrolase N-terminal domain-containing protein, partial [Oscillospiraceae bacterium]|nr:glycoside hydrolase N-terminal domain-containing protein [Oscillospiraceae bacterium]